MLLEGGQSAEVGGAGGHRAAAVVQQTQHVGMLRLAVKVHAQLLVGHQRLQRECLISPISGRRPYYPFYSRLY